MSATWAGVGQLALLLVALAACYRPLGDYLAHVFTPTRHWAVERWIYRVVRVDPDSEQRWSTYAYSVLGFSFVGVVLLYLFQRIQQWLPLASGHAAVVPSMAFNTAVSFATNTNWQSYVPERTLGSAVPMIGLTVQNFVSGAVGIAVAMALIRGFVRADTDRLGNAWVDIVRGTVRVLLPIAFVSAIVLIGLGVVQSLRSGVAVTGLDGAHRTLTLYPAASEEAIKELGTNGGGIFNANSAHPFENPDGWSNLIEIFLELVIPVSLTRTFGVLVRDRRQGYTLLGVMAVIWGGMLAIIWWAEAHPTGPAALLAGGGTEGKELRFGIPGSALFANSTTSTSTGAVNSMHDSFSGLGGGGALLNMMFGEVSPGGVGTGIYSILVMAIIVHLAICGRALPATDQQALEAAAGQALLALRQQRMSAQAEAARRKAETTELRTALLSAVGHDLRTPLTSIKAAVGSLRDPELHLSTQDTAELLATVEESADRLAGLVDNLLDSSRLATGAVEPNLRPIGYDEVVALALSGIDDRRLVEVDVDEHLPTVLADAGLLERVVANVVDNALRHGAGGAAPVVAVRASAYGGQVELRVVDHGKGLPRGSDSAVFAPFQRLGDRDATTGVGLGLSVAKGFMTAMGGTIRAEDTPGGGLTVVLSLPASAKEDSDGAERPVGHQGAGGR